MGYLNTYYVRVFGRLGWVGLGYKKRSLLLALLYLNRLKRFLRKERRSITLPLLTSSDTHNQTYLRNINLQQNTPTNAPINPTTQQSNNVFQPLPPNSPLHQQLLRLPLQILPNHHPPQPHDLLPNLLLHPHRHGSRRRRRRASRPRRVARMEGYVGREARGVYA